MFESLSQKQFREKYWLASLVVLIFLLATLTVYSLWSYVSGLLGACTLYVVVRDQMLWLTRKRKMSNTLAASLLLLEVIVLFLIPVLAVLLLLINKLQNTTIDVAFVINQVGHYLQAVKEQTGIDLLSSSTVESVSKITGQVLQSLLSGVTSVFINVMLLAFVLFFMLVGHEQMEKYAFELLPFRDENKTKMLHETKIIIHSNAIGVPLIALIQGGFAYLGFLIFGVADPVLYALFTAFATIIPVVGTALVWVPLCVYLFVTKDWGNAVGLTLYCVIVISNVDNLARLILQKKIGDIHPLITILGVMLGLYAFGFWGIIFGPLMLSLLCLFIDFFKKEYIDRPVTES